MFEHHDDIVDVRDLTDRVDFLRDNPLSEEEKAELKAIEAVLEELRGSGGDHQWEGHWYPLTLIANDYFGVYAEELVRDIGDLPENLPSYLEIDWYRTADNIRADYTAIEIDERTYWYR